jgi:hypothetical protein
LIGPKRHAASRVKPIGTTKPRPVCSNSTFARRMRMVRRRCEEARGTLDRALRREGRGDPKRDSRPRE